MPNTKPPIHVLVVEDDLAIQEMLRFKLTKHGYSVATADNGLLGLEACRKERPDLVLLDLRMPVMSGDEMLKNLRSTEWGAKIRVIILTNISRDEAPHALRFLGVNRYIVKAHYTPAEILKVVEEVLR